MRHTAWSMVAPIIGQVSVRSDHKPFDDAACFSNHTAMWSSFYRSWQAISALSQPLACFDPAVILQPCALAICSSRYVGTCFQMSMQLHTWLFEPGPSQAMYNSGFNLQAVVVSWIIMHATAFKNQCLAANCILWQQLQSRTSLVFFCRLSQCFLLDDMSACAWLTAVALLRLWLLGEHCAISAR